MWVTYLPKIVFRCFNRVAESFLISCIFNVDFLISCGFFVNIFLCIQTQTRWFLFTNNWILYLMLCVSQQNIERYNTSSYKMYVCLLAQYNIYSYLFPIYLWSTARTTLSHFLWVLSEFYQSFRQFWAIKFTGKVIFGRVLGAFTSFTRDFPWNYDGFSCLWKFF